MRGGSGVTGGAGRDGGADVLDAGGGAGNDGVAAVFGGAGTAGNDDLATEFDVVGGVVVTSGVVVRTGVVTGGRVDAAPAAFVSVEAAVAGTDAPPVALASVGDAVGNGGGARGGAACNGFIARGRDGAALRAVRAGARRAIACFPSIDIMVHAFPK